MNFTGPYRTESKLVQLMTWCRQATGMKRTNIIQDLRSSIYHYTTWVGDEKFVFVITRDDGFTSLHTSHLRLAWCGNEKRTLLFVECSHLLTM